MDKVKTPVKVTYIGSKDRNGTRSLTVVITENKFHWSLDFLQRENGRLVLLSDSLKSRNVFHNYEKSIQKVLKSIG